MTPVRQGSPGATRICPHCRASILESATVCPACRHHLRVTDDGAARAVASFSALRVDGTIQHPDVGEVWEYSVLLSIQDERGNDIARQVIGVGALRHDQQRKFTLSVEVFGRGGARPTTG
jgi:hypothetical protein